MGSINKNAETRHETDRVTRPRHRVILVTDIKLVKDNLITPRDAPQGHRRGNNPVEYVFFLFLLLVVTKSNVEY